MALDRTDDAIAAFERSLGISRDLKDRTMEADALLALSRVYRSIGEWREIVPVAKRAVRIYEVLKNRRATLASLSLLGEAYGALFDRENAREVYHRARDLALSLDDSNTLNKLEEKILPLIEETP
jgi:tetratricopeptide (TPR) repeat protein